MGNLHVRKQFESVISMVEQGASLTTALRKANAWPASTVDMIAIGEQTGHLGQTLLKISRRHERELNSAIDKMTSLIQPIIILVLALVVGVVAYAIFMGIFESIGGLKLGVKRGI
jgi:type II secretory pathway component PulF